MNNNNNNNNKNILNDNNYNNSSKLNNNCNYNNNIMLFFVKFYYIFNFIFLLFLPNIFANEKDNENNENDGNLYKICINIIFNNNNFIFL